MVKLALFYLSKNPLSPSGWRGSIVCITSTSGYFGSTGNAAYIASKHGVVGLVRAALGRANLSRVKLNAIAPCYTPTGITAGLADMVKQAGLESNRPEDVALAIACMAADASAQGMACLVSLIQTLLHPRTATNSARSGGSSRGSWNSRDKTS